MTAFPHPKADNNGTLLGTDVTPGGFSGQHPDMTSRSIRECGA